jgi:3',5'-cyclic AMP phosphodiesterase CpdA
VTEADGGGPVSPIVIAHVSDLHLGAHDATAVDTLPADVAAARPTLTVITGDITMRARPDEFCLAVELLARLPEPQLVVPGNHDVPLGPVSRLTAPYLRYSVALGTGPAPSILHPSARSPGTVALGLNSMPRWRWKSGRVTRRQSAAITATFGPTTPDAVRLVALHHPPFVGGLARLGGRGCLVTALAEARVDLVLAGHTHIPETREVELGRAGRNHRLIEVVAGTATSLRTRGAGRSWSLIVVDGCAVEVRERRQAGRGWRTTRTVRFDRRT